MANRRQAKKNAAAAVNKEAAKKEVKTTVAEETAEKVTAVEKVAEKAAEVKEAEMPRQASPSIRFCPRILLPWYPVLPAPCSPYPAPRKNPVPDHYPR